MPPTPSTHRFWSCFAHKWGRCRFLLVSTPSTPNNKIFMVSPCPLKRHLPHLPTGFGRVLQINGVDVGFYPYLPLLPHIPQINYLCRGHALQKTPTPSTHRFWSCYTYKWGRCRFLPISTTSIPNKLFMQRSYPPKDTYPIYPQVLVVLYV